METRERDIMKVGRYLLAAEISSLVVTAIWAVFALASYVISIEGYIILSSPSTGSSSGGFVGAILLIIGLFRGIVFTILLVASVIVSRRAIKMRHLLKAWDFEGLKKSNSLGIAIVALIFTLVIPGVILLLVRSRVRDLHTVIT
ncbi:MAG: hypothetical protein M1393_03555 [Candidatus Thermoplasmatota archaeon]|jgi:hypothetical protein|nr:hypothetical protein [Candidatus Thermoplasmatota archaeon]MCL6090099.1 hypothetical protein [Candidatus Thermoplasmatota archaeon]